MRHAALALAAVSMLGGAPARGVEIVADGGFDDPAHAAWDFENFETVPVSTIEIDAADANGDAGSGSLRLRKSVGVNPNSLRGTQCIEVALDEAYTASASLRIPATSSDADGAPIFRIQWFDGPGCAGGVLTASDPFFFPVSLVRDEWLVFGPSDASVPPAARSGRLYVGVAATVNIGSPSFFEASWDEVSIVPEPAAGAAASALLALLALRSQRR